MFIAPEFGVVDKVIEGEVTLNLLFLFLMVAGGCGSMIFRPILIILGHFRNSFVRRNFNLQRFQ